MSRSQLARQKANGLIHQHRVATLEAAGISLVYTDELERLKARVAELERQNKLLCQAAADGVAMLREVAAK